MSDHLQDASEIENYLEYVVKAIFKDCTFPAVTSITVNITQSGVGTSGPTTPPPPPNVGG